MIDTIIIPRHKLCSFSFVKENYMNSQRHIFLS